MVNSKTRGTTKLLAIIMAFLMMAYGMFQTLPALADEGGTVRQEQTASSESPSDAPRSEDKKDGQDDAPSAKQDEESNKYDEQDERGDSLAGTAKKANAPPAFVNAESTGLQVGDTLDDGNGNTWVVVARPENDPGDANITNLYDAMRLGFTLVPVGGESTGNVSVPVNVNWTDNDDEAGERPSTLTYVLYALENGNLVKKATQSASASGFTFSGLPERGDDGNLIVYYVAVSPITNYYITASSGSQAVVTVPEGHAWSFVKALGDTSVNFTMTYGAPLMIPFTVIVEWDDEGSESERPDSVKFELHRDGSTDGEDLVLTSADEGTSEQTLPGDFNDSWVRTIQVYGKKDNAPYFIGDYSYYNVEHPEIDGYSLDNMASRYTRVADQNFSHTYKNVWIYRYKKTASQETVSFPVQKNWDDNDDADGKRPETIYVGAYANGNATEPVRVKELSESSAEPWQCVFAGLPKNDEQGNPIAYTVDEISTPAGYTKEVTGDMGSGFTITNSVIEDVDIPVSVVWNDQDNINNLRPSSVFVRIYANGANPDTDNPSAQQSVSADGNTPWAHTFSLPEKNQDGAITYQAVAPDNIYYDKAITGDMENGFVITYALKAEYESLVIPVSIVWEDNNNELGKRPSYVWTSLVPSGENHTGSMKFDQYFNGEKFGTDNAWALTQTVPKNGLDGEPLTYTIDAGHIPNGYTREISGDQSEGFVITYAIRGDAPEMENVSITIKKTWNDNGNILETRPESVTFFVFDEDISLYASDGRVTEPMFDSSRVAQALVGRYKYITSAESEQDCVVDDLPKYDGDGNEIQYYIYELASSYRITKMKNSVWDGKNPVEFENSPITLRVAVEKIWDDDNDAAGVRPDRIRVTLRNAGRDVATTTLSKDDAMVDQDGNRWVWNSVFGESNVPLLDKDAKEIEYELVEDMSAFSSLYYCDEVTRTIKPITYHLTNHYVGSPQRIIKVQKVWDDEGYEDARPASVTVRLLADGEEVDSAVLSAENQWQHTFAGDLERAGGIWVKYEVVEDPVEGYESAVTQVCDNDTSVTPYTFTVTNTRIANEKLRHVVVNKTWNDDNNAKGRRPESITVRLRADGKEVSTVKLSKDTKWSCEFSGLATYNEEGNRIYYDIVEDMVEGYSATFQRKESDVEGTLTYDLTNSLIKTPVQEAPKKDIPQLGYAGGLSVPIAYATVVAALIGVCLVLKRRN